MIIYHFISKCFHECTIIISILRIKLYGLHSFTFAYKCSMCFLAFLLYITTNAKELKKKKYFLSITSFLFVLKIFIE